MQLNFSKYGIFSLLEGWLSIVWHFETPLLYIMELINCIKVVGAMQFLRLMCMYIHTQVS
jgi:hypothetical protein